MHRLSILLITFSLIWHIPASLNAQPHTEVDWLVVGSPNGLWAWVDDAAHPIDFCSTEGLASPLMLAPNGDHLAYRVANPDGATVIHLCHGIDLAEYVLPASPNVRVKNPSWSVDSRYVGWLTRTDPLTKIEYYTLANRRLTTIETGLRNPEEIYWTTGGILLQDTYEFYLYSLSGEILARFPIPESGFRSYLVAKVGDQEILVGIARDGSLYSHPVGNGDWLPLSGILQLVAPEAPLSRLALNFDPKTNTWAAVTADGVSHPLNYTGSSATITIAPNGQSIAFVRERQVYLWQPDGTETLLPLNSGFVVWSPTEWHIAIP